MNQATPILYSNDDALRSLIKESVQRFLTEYKNGTTDFSNFTSIFSRFLNNLPDPPLEIIWFYSALTFLSVKPTAQDSQLLVMDAKDLFQLLVSCSSACNAVKKIAALAPVVYKLNRLVCSRNVCIREIENFLEVIISYMSISCGTNSEEHDEMRVLGSCFLDIMCLWVVDEIGESCQFTEALRVFFPLVSDGIREEIASEGNEMGIVRLAGIVMNEVFLLRLCLKFEFGVSSELEKELHEWTAQLTSAFRNYYFFDTILRMLLEPVLPVITFLNSEDEVTLREFLYNTAIKMDFSWLGLQKGIHLSNGHLKNLAITWLFVADYGMNFWRENGDKSNVISYGQAFSESYLPSKLIKWVTNQQGARNKISTPRVSIPSALIRWLLIVEDQGIKVFDDAASKIYAKTIIYKSKVESGFFTANLDGKNLVKNYFICSCIGNKRDDKIDGDLNIVDAEDSTFFTTPMVLNATTTNETRKRKEERKAEGYEQVKFIKCHLNCNSAKENVPRLDDYDAFGRGSEVENPDCGKNIVYMEEH